MKRYPDYELVSEIHKFLILQLQTNDKTTVDTPDEDVDSFDPYEQSDYSYSYSDESSDESSSEEDSED